MGEEAAGPPAGVAPGGLPPLVVEAAGPLAGAVPGGLPPLVVEAAGPLAGAPGGLPPLVGVGTPLGEEGVAVGVGEGPPAVGGEAGATVGVEAELATVTATFWPPEQ